jgi:hypothetical protein
VILIDVSMKQILKTRVLSGTATILALLSIAVGQVALAQDPTWVELGPGPGAEGPIVNNLTEGINEALEIPLSLLPVLGISSPSNPVSGAVNAISISSGNAHRLYAGTVNGGVWRADWPKSVTSAKARGWTPLTDHSLPSLSINSLAISPSDSNRLFAGTGSTSSADRDGSPGFGVARSTDGGITWEVFASNTFGGKPINSIVPTGFNSAGMAASEDDEVVLAATWYNANKDDGGVYRSTDGGKTFTRISDGNLQARSLPSGTMSEGLPWGGVSSLVADPTDRNRLYAAVTRFGASFSSSRANDNVGIYRTEDGGVHWTPAVTFYANAPGPELFNGLVDSVRILLAVGERTGTLFAMVIVDKFNVDVTKRGTLHGVFQSMNHGDGMWTSMGQPSPTVFPGSQARLHGAIAAHPTDPNVVFISGDRQEGPFPNVNGCTTSSANAFRGDASFLPANPWQNMVGNGANSTSPHADCRTLVFDANGNLLAGTDGGIYLLNDPDSPASRKWFSLNHDLGCTEFVSVAYDPLIGVAFSGAQDVGSVYQVPRSLFDRLLGRPKPSWKTLQAGDGGVVAIDAKTYRSVEITVRYACNEYLTRFSRWYFSRLSQRGGGVRPFAGPQNIELNITNGVGTGQKLLDFENSLKPSTVQFYNPYVLNAIDPTRMLIGTKYLYESMDRGDSLNNLLNVPETNISSQPQITSLTYGSRQNGNPMADALYAGTDSRTILHRAMLGDPITTLSAYPGSAVRNLVMDSQNFKNIYVVDDKSEIWASSDEGGTWTRITANLQDFTNDVRCIEIFSPNTMIEHTVLIVGGLGGVWQIQNPLSPDSSWTPLSSGLPHALFNDLHYNFDNDVLVTSSLGRGAWTLTNFFQPAHPPATPP